MDKELLSKAVAQCKARIDTELEKIAILHEIEDIPHAAWMPLYFEYVDIRIPYSLPVLNENGAFLAALGWVEKGRMQLSTGYLVVDYSHPARKTRIEITLDTNLSGSLCKRVAIGEKTETIFEVVCLEA